MTRHGAGSSREFIFHALAGLAVMPIILGFNLYERAKVYYMWGKSQRGT